MVISNYVGGTIPMEDFVNIWNEAFKFFFWLGVFKILFLIVYTHIMMYYWGWVTSDFKLSAIFLLALITKWSRGCRRGPSEAAGVLRHIHVNDVLGNMCCMYSVLLFILSSSGMLLICMASDSCLSMHLLLYICVIVIVKVGLCSSCLWCVCMCLCIIELSLFVS